MYPIPPNATRIRYLKSTGTQWIDPDDYMAYGDEFSFDFVIDNINSNSGNYKGGYVLASNTDGHRTYPLGWYSVTSNVSDQHFLFCFEDDASSYTKFPTPTAGIRYKVKCHVESGNMQLTVNGTTYTDTATNVANSNKLALFARSSAESNGKVTSVNVLSSVTLYSLAHTRNGTLVRDFVPVRVGQTGYLFDRVSGQLFGNDGTGAFVLGPDTFAQGVVPTRMMAMGVRRKKAMKFIRSTGTYYPSREVAGNGSYLNTGINPDAQTSIEIICRITPGSTFQHWAYLLGSQTSNDNANTFSVRGLSTNQTSPPWRNYRWGHSSWQDFGITTDSWSGSSDWHTIVISRSGLVLDGVLYAATGTTSTSVPGKPIFIGCINRGGKAQNCIPLDIASLKIWSGTTLQFDGKPEVVNGVAGLKDSVSGSLFSSSLASNQYQLLQEPAS